MKEQLERARDKDNAWKSRAEAAEREVARLLTKVADLEGGVGGVAGGPDRFSECSVPATPGSGAQVLLAKSCPISDGPRRILSMSRASPSLACLCRRK